MRTGLAPLKQAVVKLCTSVCFYTRMLSVLRVALDKWQYKRDARGHAVFPFVQKRNQNNFQIFTYHRVNNDRDPFFYGTPIDVFAKQMEYLATHCHVLPLEEAIERMQRHDLPDHAVVITFDDGYRDVYTHAFPILQRLALPATVFLSTSVIGSGKVLWHDRVFAAFRETRTPVLEQFGHNLQTYPLRTVAEKLVAQHAVLHFLRSCNDHERSYWIEHLVAQLQTADRREDHQLMLTWEDVKTMRRHGIAFGSHTISHPILSKISCAQAREEIFVSKAIIEQHLALPVRTFAYPNGGREDFNAGTQALLKEAGYVCALTTLFGTNAAGQDLFALRRGQPWEEHLPTFATKLSWYKFAS